jgi:hypothetical protein
LCRADRAGPLPEHESHNGKRPDPRPHCAPPGRPGNERRHRNPLAPLSIFRINGLAFADVTQLIAFAGFLAMFFFLTLYMQNVLHYSPIKTGVGFPPLLWSALRLSVWPSSRCCVS